MAIVGASNASAEPAESTELGGLSIWYRSSDQCPTAAVFLERLSRLGRYGRLARAGDRIDFVVTLDSTESGSFGRLGRLAERGTIAIREVEAPKCEGVAEALALSLDLALDPCRRRMWLRLRLRKHGSVRSRPRPRPPKIDRPPKQPTTMRLRATARAVEQHDERVGCLGRAGAAAHWYRPSYDVRWRCLWRVRATV